MTLNSPRSSQAQKCLPLLDITSNFVHAIQLRASNHYTLAKDPDPAANIRCQNVFLGGQEQVWSRVLEKAGPPVPAGCVKVLISYRSMKDRPEDYKHLPEIWKMDLSDKDEDKLTTIFILHNRHPIADGWGEDSRCPRRGPNTYYKTFFEQCVIGKRIRSPTTH